MENRGRELACCLCRCTYWGTTNESWRLPRRIVVGQAQNEARHTGRQAPLLDDVGDNTADGPVGAPEIPTRTGRNARLKVGSTTDSRAAMNARDHVQQGRAVTSPCNLLLPLHSLPSFAFPPRPFLAPPLSLLPPLRSSASSSVDPSARSRVAPRSILHPSFVRLPSSHACYSPHQRQDRALAAKRPTPRVSRDIPRTPEKGQQPPRNSLVLP